VELLDMATDAQVVYQIVGNIEADINENRIAISSPIARALIGREAGEDIIVEAPSGNMEYAITAIHFK
jgi:transcription elongation factor GreA